MTDVVVVGGGIVGLATALALIERSPLEVKILEKEDTLGSHQTGHNSGVLHSGLYYRPGSLKARLCVEGRKRMVEFCREEGLPYRQSGKLVVASDDGQIPALEELQRRGTTNGLRGVERIGADGIKDHEPHAVGVAGLYVPEAGVLDFGAVAGRIADRLRAAGVVIETGATFVSAEERPSGCVVRTADREIGARLMVNTAGLYADVVARSAGTEPPVRIVPFRGEYFTLQSPDLIRSAIYPVPDPRFPFLGVHFTRRIDGTVEAGPNAVLAWGREHYRGSRADLGESWATLRYRGFWRMAARYWRTGLGELVGSWSRTLYSRRARELVPAVGRTDLIPAGSGVRAQAVWPDGSLADDFVIGGEGPFLHVLNAPSPAATAAFEIGEHLAAVAVDRLDQ
jgi:L-2-hydroxyglutarate oxidase LhgO